MSDQVNKKIDGSPAVVNSKNIMRIVPVEPGFDIHSDEIWRMVPIDLNALLRKAMRDKSGAS